MRTHLLYEVEAPRFSSGEGEMVFSAGPQGRLGFKIFKSLDPHIPNLGLGST